MNKVTMTGNIKVEDISFTGMRKQSQVLEDIKKRDGNIDIENGEIIVPVSLTPESVKRYFNELLEVGDENECKIYKQCVRWIDEMLELKKRVIYLESKYEKDGEEDNSTVESTEE